ncbi:Outer membrane family protein [Forsythia ovata]|uniref:Outer membrane family protein n=1 Tax=Forsythia ovata TaxID=205694 RepID=A0ABD1U738_9LAMI
MEPLIMSVPLAQITKLILELNEKLRNIPFHHLTNHFLGIQIPKIHNLHTCIPILVVPLLHHVPNPLQQSCAHLLLFSQHLQDLSLHRQYNKHGIACSILL